MVSVVRHRYNVIVRRMVKRGGGGPRKKIRGERRRQNERNSTSKNRPIIIARVCNGTSAVFVLVHIASHFTRPGLDRRSSRTSPSSLHSFSNPFLPIAHRGPGSAGTNYNWSSHIYVYTCIRPYPMLFAPSWDERVDMWRDGWRDPPGRMQVQRVEGGRTKKRLTRWFK